MSVFRRLMATAAVALGAAGCALTPTPVEQASLESPAIGSQNASPGAALDLRAKFNLPKEGRKRDRATFNAEYQLQLEADESGPPSAAKIFRAHAQRKSLVNPSGVAKAAGLQPSQWQAIGPSNVGGRVRALAFDPRNGNRLFAGTASGGLWISNDGGATWQANNDFLPNLSVTTIVFDPANPDVMYLGTGEASAGLVGVGVFKSVDAGATWRHLATTNPDSNADWRFVNRLAIHPTQGLVLLAALTNNSFSTGGIYRSTDAGATWTRSAGFKALDVAFDPRTPSNAVAGLDDGTLAFSRDGGVTWSRTAPLIATPSGRGNTARAEIAFARTQPGLVYASVDNAKGEVWRSLDSGATWEHTATPAHLNNQGDYDNAIWVDPLDHNHVVVGGLDLYRSRDGGLNFTKISDWRFAPSSPHADHHALVSPPNYGPSNPVLYNGNDGGVYRAVNIFATNDSPGSNGWSNMNNGLAVTQFYSGAGRTAAGGRVIGGTQDNGSLQLGPSGQWTPFRGGDGGFVAVDPQNDLLFFGEYVYLSIHRSSTTGVSQFICSGITEAMPSEGGNAYCGADATKKANFIAPFILDPNNSRRMVAGANSLWVSDNVTALTPAWRTIKAPSAATDNFINAIAVAEGNGNVIWVGHNNGELYRSLDALSSSPTWTRVGQIALPGRRIQRITIDKDNHNRVIVAYTGFVSHNVWQTHDGGTSWSSITGNLPFAPVFDVKRHPSNPQWLYAATSVGVYTSENGGANWSTTNEGPANIRVRELFWLDNTTLGAATYGRGMFKVNVASGGPANYQDLWWAGQQENGWGLNITQHGATLFVTVFVYDPEGKPVWFVIPGGTWNAGFTSYTGNVYIPTGSHFAAYDASRFNPGAVVGSATLTFTGANTASFQYTINGVAGTKTIQRQAFGPQDSTPVATYADLWWGGNAQNGWGVAISQQYRNLFAVWYTYDTAGRTTWYVLPAGSWTTENVYSGTAYRTTGSAWLGATYNPSAFTPSPAGTLTFRFTDLHNGTMSYEVDGVTGSKAITRQPF